MAMAELSGVRVLVTRPQRQAGELVRRIEQAGGEALVFPVMEIQSRSDAADVQERLAQIDRYTLAIFISANAVEDGLAALASAGGSLSHLRIAAVGRATAAALQAAGQTVQLVPDSACTSEALLAMPPMQFMQGERVLIFRGEGGRELLATPCARAAPLWSTPNATGACCRTARIARR
jgi:uroporphyrinogen-III synthase